MNFETINAFAEQWLFYCWHIAWQAAVVGLIALFFAHWGRRISSPLRYGILLVSLVKFVVPPLMASPTGVFGFLSIQTQVAVVTTNDTGGSQEEDASFSVVSSDSFVGVTASSSRDELLYRQFVHPESSSNGPGMLDLIGPSVRTDELTGPQRTREDSPDVTVPGPPTETYSAAGLVPTPSWPTVLMLVHALGVAIGLVITSFRLWQLRRSISEMTAAPGAVQAQFDECAKRLKLRSVPELWLKSKAIVPFSFGVLRPVVVISEDHVDELSMDELRTVFMHELAHHRRFDLWMVTAQALVTALWWFHPIVWLLNRRLRIVREDCCDDMLLMRRLVTDDGVLRDIAARFTVAVFDRSARAGRYHCGSRAVVVESVSPNHGRTTAPSRPNHLVVGARPAYYSVRCSAWNVDRFEWSNESA